MPGNLHQMYNIAGIWVADCVLGADALAAVGSSYTLMVFLLIPQIGVTGIWVSVPIGWALADLIGFAAMRWHTL